MKKLVIALGVVFFLLISAAVVIPLVVDVDKYRPQIIEAANKSINGRLDLGKLSLSLWGQIKIEIGGVKLSDSLQREIVSVKDAYFHVPFSSLLSGAPVISLRLNKPVLNVTKNKAGKLNVLNLVKEAPAVAAPSAPGNSVSSTPGTTSGTALPAFVTRSRLGAEMKDALLTYRDEGTGLSAQVKDLNLVLKDVSLSHPTELEVWADLDTKVGKGEKAITVKGPVRLTGKAQTQLKDGRLDQVSLTALANLDDLAINVPGDKQNLFEKKKGVAAHAEIQLKANEKEAQIEKLTAQFFNVDLTASGSVTQLNAPADSKVSPVVKLNLKTNSIDLKPWGELVPMLKDFELGGRVHLDASASGPSDRLGYQAKIDLAEVGAKAPGFKAQPKFDGFVQISTDQIEKLLVVMKAPGNDLKVEGKLISFTKPRADFAITSSGLDLDQLIDFPPPGKKSAAPAPANPAPGTQQKGGAAPAEEDKDLALNSLRQNKMLNDFVGNFSVDLKFLKAQGVKISDIVCNTSFKELTLGMNRCGLKVFSGSIKSSSTIRLRPSIPTYDFSAEIVGLNLNQAVESQLALFKNTVKGTTSFSLSGQGASFNTNPALSNLKAKGNLKVAPAEFTSIDVMKMVNEAVNKSIGQLGDKFPPLKNQKIGNLPNVGSKYESITSDFVISGGRFSAPNFFAKAQPGSGVDIRGNTQVGLLDTSLATSWDIIDTHNLTHAKDLSVEQAGVRVEHVLADKGTFHFPVNAGGTLSAPTYSYKEVPEFLGKVALTNAGAAASGRAKEEIKKRAGDLIKQVAPPAVQEQIQNRLKGLFN